MPEKGQPAPEFALRNQDGELVRLSDLRGQRVIIFSFLIANTMICNNQACGFRDALPQIKANDAVVFGVSNDSERTLAKWKASRNLQYDLLSDPDHNMLDEWGAWGLDMRLIKLPMPTRSYWVIDEDGILVDQQIGIGAQASIEKALAAVEQLAQSKQAQS
ncbi:MAG: peroxiredoxin [Chloroflexi bacterium]|nr:peroxiredoxin [Chloroflexota bacterium]MCY4247660.1 peroxiredoxin [Chloroflexota bacterium]